VLPTQTSPAKGENCFGIIADTAHLPVRQSRETSEQTSVCFFWAQFRATPGSFAVC